MHCTYTHINVKLRKKKFFLIHPLCFFHQIFWRDNNIISKQEINKNDFFNYSKLGQNEMFLKIIRKKEILTKYARYRSTNLTHKLNAYATEITLKVVFRSCTHTVHFSFSLSSTLGRLLMNKCKQMTALSGCSTVCECAAELLDLLTMCE